MSQIWQEERKIHLFEHEQNYGCIFSHQGCNDRTMDNIVIFPYLEYENIQ